MEYFTLNELVKSNTAIVNHIDNTPDKEVENHLKELIKFLNPLRESWGSPIIITSGYRCKMLNEKIDGSKTSAHLTGYACDMIPKNGKFNEFVEFLKDYLKDKSFDQCIIEKSPKSKWIHLGLKNLKGLQRKQIFNLCV